MQRVAAEASSLLLAFGRASCTSCAQLASREPSSFRLAGVSQSHASRSVSTSQTSTDAASLSTGSSSALDGGLPVDSQATPTLTAHQRKRVQAILAVREQRRSKVLAKQPAVLGDDLQMPVLSWEALAVNSEEPAGLSPPQSSATATLPAHLFAAPVNPHTLYQTIRWQLAKRRAGTGSSKTRAEVSGGGRKPWNQKGSGRARQGSIRAPQWRGGGIAHGPKPRDFSYPLNKMIRRSGLRSALCAKVAQGRLVLVDTAALAGPTAEKAFRQCVLANAGLYRNLNKHVTRVRGVGLRRRVLGWLSNSDLPALAARADDGDDAAVADSIVDALKEDAGWTETTFASEMARTGLYKGILAQMLPSDWDAQPLSVQQANTIIANMNSEIDEDRVARLQKKRQVARHMSMLIVDSSKEGEDGGSLLRRAVGNMPRVDAIPAKGANVYDIVRHEYLVITVPALQELIDRLTRPLNRRFKPAGYDWKAWSQSEVEAKARQADLAASFPAWLAEQAAKRKASAGTA